MYEIVTASGNVYKLTQRDSDKVHSCLISNFCDKGTEIPLLLNLYRNNGRSVSGFSRGIRRRRHILSNVYRPHNYSLHFVYEPSKDSMQVLYIHYDDSQFDKYHNNNSDVGGRSQASFNITSIESILQRCGESSAEELILHVEGRKIVTTTVYPFENGNGKVCKSLFFSLIIIIIISSTLWWFFKWSVPKFSNPF